MELIIIYLIASFVFNVVLGDKNKQKQKSRKKGSGKLRDNSQTTNQKGNINKRQYSRKKGSILQSLQDELEKIESELTKIDTERRKNMHSRDQIDGELRVKDLQKSKKPADSMSMYKRQVLTTEKKVSSMAEEGYHRLADESISSNAQDEYNRSLYGSDEESPLFDYDYQSIDQGEVTEDSIEVFFQDGNEIDLKKMVVIKEILDKPVTLRD